MWYKLGFLRQGIPGVTYVHDMLCLVWSCSGKGAESLRRLGSHLSQEVDLQADAKVERARFAS